MGSSTYIVAVIIIVILTSASLAFWLNKKSLLNIQIICAISLSSILISVMFPFMWGMLSGLNNSLAFISLVLPILMITVYLALILVFTLLISTVITDKKFRAISDRFKNNSLNTFFSNFEQNLSQSNAIPSTDESIRSENNADNIINVEPISNVENAQNISADVENNFIAETAAASDGYSINIIENTQDVDSRDLDFSGIDIHDDDIQGKNILEKSVDSEENIDTMCIETIIDNADSVGLMENISTEIEKDDMIYEILDGVKFENSTNYDANSKNEPETAVSIDEVREADTVELPENTVDYYIDVAFKMKQEDNLEEAVLNYMYALDQKPDLNLVFWIILDICVLYKSLGQAELAKDILESYIAGYGGLMDAEVKAEIEKNLI